MRFSEAMKALEEGKKVYPVSPFFKLDYVVKENICDWFEMPKAAHYIFDEWEIYDEVQ